MRRQIALAVTAMLHAATAASYEQATHSYMTGFAFQNSVIPSLDRRLGFHVKTFPIASFDKPFGDQYFDMGPPMFVRRSWKTFEELRMAPSSAFSVAADRMRVSGWLNRGVVREDDWPRDTAWPFDAEPLIRPFNHFYDAQHDKPSTVGGRTDGLALGARSPDWAVGAIDAFAPSPSTDDQRTNHFTIVDAREAMWRALTLTDKNNLSVASVDGMTREQVRYAYWATTFRALGDVSHMIQDLAQPQHARNEPHNGSGPAVFQDHFNGHSSTYETYMLFRAKQEKSFDVKDPDGNVTSSNLGDPLPEYIDLSSISFDRYSDFFSTSPGSSTAPGYGIADFAGRGFFSQAKNLGQSDLPLPSNDPSWLTACGTSATDWAGNPIAPDKKIALLCGPVPDEVEGSPHSSVRLTASSAWDDALKQQGAGGVYSLVRENLDDQASLLLPKAVRYTSGLYDYFFRGQLEITPPDGGVFAFVDHAKFSGTGAPTTDLQGFKGFSKLRLNLRNMTPSINSAKGGAPVVQTMGAGKLVAVIKYRRDMCYQDDLGGWATATADQCIGNQQEEILVSNTILVPGGVSSATPQQFEFTFPDEKEIPINIADAYLQVVFRGSLGSEADAVVVETIDLGEPTYVSYLNSSDYIFVKFGEDDFRAFTRDQVAADSSLLAMVQPNCRDSDGKLVPSCLQPRDGGFPTTLGSPASGHTSFWLTSLPVGRFTRVAYLAPATPNEPIAANCGLDDATGEIAPMRHEYFIGTPGPTGFAAYPFLGEALQTNRGVNSNTTVECFISIDGVTKPPIGGVISGVGNPVIDTHPLPIEVSSPAW